MRRSDVRRCQRRADQREADQIAKCAAMRNIPRSSSNHIALLATVISREIALEVSRNGRKVQCSRGRGEGEEGGKMGRTKIERRNRRERRDGLQR